MNRKDWEEMLRGRMVVGQGVCVCRGGLWVQKIRVFPICLFGKHHLHRTVVDGVLCQLFAYICIKLILPQLPLRLFLMQKLSQQNEPGPPNKANIWIQMHAGKVHGDSARG